MHKLISPFVLLLLLYLCSEEASGSTDTGFLIEVEGMPSSLAMTGLPFTARWAAGPMMPTPANAKTQPSKVGSTWTNRTLQPALCIT